MGDHTEKGSITAGLRRDWPGVAIIIATLGWLYLLLPRDWYAQLSLTWAPTSLESGLRLVIAAAALTASLVLLVWYFWKIVARANVDSGSGETTSDGTGQSQVEEPSPKPQGPETKGPTATVSRVGKPSPSQPLDSDRLRLLVLYHVALATVLVPLLIRKLATGAYKDPDAAALGTCSNTPGAVLTDTLFTMMIAGAVGGVLCNLRGFYEWLLNVRGDEKIPRHHHTFPQYLELPFYLRPFLSGLVGLASFFFGYFFTVALTTGQKLNSAAAAAPWETFRGRLPYVGLALLAGFVAFHFTQRLSETAKSLFAIPDPDKASEQADKASEQAGKGPEPPKSAT